MGNSPILQIDHISKKYGNFSALSDVSLSVNYKDFYALLGANGAGKTTLIGIVTDLVKPTAGSVQVNGYDLLSQTELAKQQIGVVPQEINLNIFEKVDQTLYQQAQYYGLKVSDVKERADYLLDKLYLSDKKKSIVRQLSGGMKRRLMIARAMIHSPKLLLLDEPTAGVDVEVRQSLWEFLRHENENGLSIVLTTHYLEEAETLCNRVGMIKNGKCVFEGNMRELLSDIEGEHIVIEVDKENLSLPASLQAQCVKQQGCTIEIQLHNKQMLQEVINQINSAGGNVVRIEHQAGRLEQVFTKKLARDNKN